MANEQNDVGPSSANKSECVGQTFGQRMHFCWVGMIRYVSTYEKKIANGPALFGPYVLSGGPLIYREDL